MQYSPSADSPVFIAESRKLYWGEKIKESDIALRWYNLSKGMSGRLITNRGEKVNNCPLSAEKRNSLFG